MNFRLINILMIFSLMVLISVIKSQECPPSEQIPIDPIQNSWNIPTQNNWHGLEVMTWNVKTFPISANTIDYVNEIITDILPDVIAFQEINNINSFNELENSIPAYDFIVTSGGLGLAVRRDILQIDSFTTLFTSDGWEFAWRYPLKANLSWQCGSAVLNFQIINVHLKAGGTSDDFDRRYASCEIISDYIQNNSTDNIIVAGDFNDEIDDPENSNSLWPLVSDELAYFVTTPIAGNSYYSSYPSWPSFLDHILVSENLFDEAESGNVVTIRVDDYTGYSFYHNYISDHRPVLWSITITESEIYTGLVINEIMNNPSAVPDSYGEWIELFNAGQETINLNGIVLKDENTDYHVINENIIMLPGEFVLLGINEDINVNGGLSNLYPYDNFYLSNSWDEIILENLNGVVLDMVSYDNGMTFPDIEGASMMLLNPLLDNSEGSNWVTSSNDFGNGDFGSPGYENSQAIECTFNGDTNQDGVLNVIDLVIIVQYILGNQTFSEYQICIADRNQDGNVDVLDLVILVNDILS